MRGSRLPPLLGLGLAAVVTALVGLDAEVLEEESAKRPAVEEAPSEPPPLLPLVWEGEARAAWWDDEHFLQCQWDWACAAVEWACGRRYVEWPVLRACSAEEYTVALGRGRLPARPPRTVEPLDPSGEVPAGRDWFEIGHCSRETGRVFLRPAGLAECASIHPQNLEADLNVLRLILVHEATHAHDFQYHEDLFVPGLVPNVLLEGHAWQVTETVAGAYGWTEDYKDMVRLVLRVDADVGEGDEPASAVWDAAEHARLSYTLGRRLFWQAEQLGGRAVIEEMLANPPPLSGLSQDRWQRWLRTCVRRVRER